jgi:hypothetical protein
LLAKRSVMAVSAIGIETPSGDKADASPAPALAI